jgi:hypothetical protein
MNPRYYAFPITCERGASNSGEVDLYLCAVVAILVYYAFLMWALFKADLPRAACRQAPGGAEFQIWPAAAPMAKKKLSPTTAKSKSKIHRKLA